MARHERTEATMGGISLFTRPQYMMFLRIQAAAVAGIEQALMPFEPEFAAAGIRWSLRSHAALADLAALGGRPAPATVSVLCSFDGALGAAYTLEGSRLGNAMLFRQLQAQNPVLADEASAFLGFPTAPGFWRGFTDRMNAQAPHRSRWPEILKGSISAFDVFQRTAEAEHAAHAES